MVQTNFNASDAASLAAVLLDIGSGADSATNTAYAITLTQALSAASESVGLKSGSSVTLESSFPFIVNAFTVTGTMTADLNFTGTVTLNNGVFNNASLTSNGTGTIIAGLYTGAVLGTLGDSGDSASNNGTIAYNGTFAAVEFATGTVQNGWNGLATALISGAAGGVFLETSGLVQNGGTVIATGTTSAAVVLASGTVDNGQIGDAGALISGGQNGVEITGAGVVVNAGTIIGAASDGVYLGSGTVTNGQIGDVAALIDGGPADNGVWIGAGLGIVNNFATIETGGAAGVLLEAGGRLVNGAANDTSATVIGVLEGVNLTLSGLVQNFGTIAIKPGGTSQSAIGVFLDNGGTIQNSSTAAVIGGVAWGAIVEGGGGAITNLGTIESSGTSGLGADLTAGGTIINESAATISGAFDGARISAGTVGAGAIVDNFGTIIGTVGVDFASGPTPAAGTLTNDGLIASSAGASGFAVQFGSGTERLVLRSAGTIVGHVLGAAGGGTTMELAAGTQGTLSALASDGGTVTDGNGSFVFGEIGTIALDTGASWAVAAPGSADTVINAGALNVTGGALTVSGSLSNSGEIGIAGATLIAANGILSDPGVITVGAGGVLNALGGGITAAGTADLQIGGGVSAALDVSGAGAEVTSVHGIGIGSSGQGSGLISLGGTVVAGTPFAGDDAIYTGGSAGSSGALTVSGAGSELRATGQFSVGLGGGGSLLVEDGATVITGGDTADASAGVDIGRLPGAAGQATVTGASSLLTNTGRFVVGDAGLGSLAINAGATVVTSPGTVGGLAGLVVGNAASASGSALDVSGTGAKLQVGGLLDVGVNGSGVLELSGGGSVTAGSLDAGNIASAVGEISLSGTATDLSVTGSATVADDGTGVLSVLNGATFSAASLTIGSQGDSSGALVVSGDGSVVQLSGALNIGTALGIGDLTVGPGAAVHASVVSLQGQVVLEGGLLDPTVQLINQGQTAGGFGTIAAGDIVDEGMIQAGGNKASQRLLLVQGTILGGGTLTANGALPGSNATGVLQINAGGTMELTGPVINAAATTFTDNLTPTGIYSVNNSVVDVTFADAAGVLKLDDIAGFGGTITTHQAGDSFVVSGGTLSGLNVSNGNTLTMSDSGSGGTDKIIFGSAISAAGFNIVNGNTVQVACFAAGTRIETGTGFRAVEDLCVGDRVVTAEDGSDEPVVWIGLRAVHCVSHPRPETVWPVRVRAGAFGSNVPVRDLYLSPDHAIFVNDALVPVKLLINGASIAQVRRDHVQYFHVELPRHAIILAEGLPVESYLETGDRTNFRDAADAVRLFPDFASAGTALLWETRGAAPLVTTGPALEAARRMVRHDNDLRAA